MIVELGHAFNLSELDIVSVLEGVALIFVHCNNSLLILGNVRDNELLCLFSVRVVHLEFGTVVEEDVTACAESLSENHATIVTSDRIANVIDFLLAFVAKSGKNGLQVSKNYHVEVFGTIRSHFRNDIN